MKKSFVPEGYVSINPPNECGTSIAFVPHELADHMLTSLQLPWGGFKHSITNWPYAYIAYEDTGRLQWFLDTEQITEAEAKETFERECLKKSFQSKLNE